MQLGQRRRRVILHCHIYKNAGSSIERLLWQSFGDGFAVLDAAPGHDTIGLDSVRHYLAANPHIKAISSHCIHPPVLQSGFLPLVMLRHPADRARSVYRYARQNAATPDHDVARQASFRDYVAWSLATRGPGAVLRNHQVQHLSDAAYRTSDLEGWRATRADLAQAKAAVAACPAFGLVRRFGDSCRLFNARYRPQLPSVNFSQWAENTTGDPDVSETEALAQVRDELGDDMAQALLEASALDLELYEFATRLFAERLARLDGAASRAAYWLRFTAGRIRQRIAEPELYRQWPGCRMHPTEPANVRLPPVCAAPAPAAAVAAARIAETTGAGGPA